MTQLDAALALAPAQAAQRAGEATAPAVEALAARLDALEVRARRDEALSTVVLLYGSAVLGIAAAAGLGGAASGRPRGRSLLWWLVATLALANAVLGLAINAGAVRGVWQGRGRAAAADVRDLLLHAVQQVSSWKWAVGSWVGWVAGSWRGRPWR